MSERMIPVPESALRALREGIPSTEAGERHWHAIDTLVACLPEPEPTFSDEEALAFYRALVTGDYSDDFATKQGRIYLTRLAKAGWIAPKALCPPPSPALVELVEAAREVARSHLIPSRISAAVAAYDEEG